MDGVPEGFRPAEFTGAFLANAGPYWLKHEGECWVVGMRVGVQHMNYLDIAHGGVLTTLADVALSVPVHLSEKPALAVSTVSLATNFLNPAKLGDWLEAEPVVDRLSKRLAHVHGAIRAGDRTLMTMTGVFYIMRPKAETAD
jgi:uncharacterized protein (TIGR00369 family)